MAPAGRASAHNRKIYIESGRLSAVDVSLAFLPSAFPSSGAALLPISPLPALHFPTHSHRPCLQWSCIDCLSCLAWKTILQPGPGAAAAFCIVIAFELQTLLNCRHAESTMP